MSQVDWTRMFRTTVCVVTVGATVVVTAGCGVEFGVGVPVDGYPPSAYIATTEPVYYEGRASYYYDHRWYYRDGSRWAYYRNEPPALYRRRVQAPPRQRAYEPARGRPAAQAHRQRPGDHR